MRGLTDLLLLPFFGLYVALWPAGAVLYYVVRLCSKHYLIPPLLCGLGVVAFRDYQAVEGDVWFSALLLGLMVYWVAKKLVCYLPPPRHFRFRWLSRFFNGLNVVFLLLAFSMLAFMFTPEGQQYYVPENRRGSAFSLEYYTSSGMVFFHWAKGFILFLVISSFFKVLSRKVDSDGPRDTTLPPSTVRLVVPKTRYRYDNAPQVIKRLPPHLRELMGKE